MLFKSRVVFFPFLIKVLYELHRLLSLSRLGGVLLNKLHVTFHGILEALEQIQLFIARLLVLLLLLHFAPLEQLLVQFLLLVSLLLA